MCCMLLHPIVQSGPQSIWKVFRFGIEMWKRGQYISAPFNYVMKYSPVDILWRPRCLLDYIEVYHPMLVHKIKS